MSAPLRVWRYRGWCAVCDVCKKAVAIGCADQPSALMCALNHFRIEHGRWWATQVGGGE